MEKIKPGSIGKINQPTGGNELSHFKMVENISKFLNAILAYGVLEGSCDFIYFFSKVAYNFSLYILI